MTEICKPLALHSIDADLGTDTLTAYNNAVSLAPHLGGLAIVLSERGTSFRPSPLGLAGSAVSLQPTEGYYKQRIEAGYVSVRMKRFEEFFRNRDINPSLKLLITSVFLHELGHGDTLHSFIRKNSGDTNAAFEEARATRKSQVKTLPLKGPSSAAERSWTGNTDGYRDEMQKIGYNAANWRQALTENARAYADLPLERTADDFAIEVLSQMHD